MTMLSAAPAVDPPQSLVGGLNFELSQPKTPDKKAVGVAVSGEDGKKTQLLGGYVFSTCFVLVFDVGGMVEG